MSKQFIAILAILVLGFFGLLFFTKNDGNNSNSNGSSGTCQTSNHTYGEGKSGVTLIEYGDFQCPSCGKYFPIVQQLKAKYKDQITFQFKHFPLVEIHQNALIAARAAEAAGLQNKFWEMHDLLFTNQTAWSQNSSPTNYFEQYAKQLNLDVNKFNTDLTSQGVNSTIQADLKEAKDNGYDSTPTFILDGKKLDDAQPTVEYFSNKIDEAIKAKQNSGQ